MKEPRLKQGKEYLLKTAKGKVRVRLLEKPTDGQPLIEEVETGSSYCVPSSRLNNLPSKNEIEVLKLWSNHTPIEIADIRNVGIATIRTQFAGLMKKLCSPMRSAHAMALEFGYI